MTEKIKRDPNCIFCRWVESNRQIDVFGTVAAFYDGYPVTEGHLLIVPLRHVENWLGLTDQERRDSDTLIQTLTEGIRRRDPTVTGFNIGMNIGYSAGQTIFHCHTHLIPRREGDTADPRGGVRGVIPGKRSY
jgi:diadenosine tetraphosphate (Ap4A) HIT family hydrolase